MSTETQLYAAAPSTLLLATGYGESHRPDGIDLQLTYRVHGYELPAAREVIVGLLETLVIGGVTVSQRVPLRYPATSIYPRHYAQSLDIRPVDNCCLLDPDATDSVNSLVHEWYDVTITFRALLFGINDDFPWITEQWAGGIEMVTRPGSAYYFPSDGAMVNHDCAAPVPTLDFSLTFNQVPDLAARMPGWLGLAGRVNSTTFYTPLGPPSGYAAGTIYFQGPTANATKPVFGSQVTQATLAFKWRWIPWNVIMRGDGAGFEAPVDGVGDTLLPAADLTGVYS